jgi:hypothetical protein
MAAPGTAESGDTEGTGPSAAPASEARPEDQARLSLVALRDVALAAALLSLFGGAEAWQATSELAIAGLLATLDGFGVGIALGALAHEWGHFTGARWAGGIAPLRPITRILPLYDYDYARNDARAFEWMSVGGNLAHAAVVLLLILALPLDTLGTAALVSGAFGFAVFSSTIELPVIRRARAGTPPLEALATIPRDFVRRYLPWSIGAGLLLFILL